MSHFYNNEELNFYKSIKENSLFVTRFLNLNEQTILKSKVNNATFYGGYNEAEMKRASNFEGLSEDDFNITTLELSYNKNYYSLTHRDVLGALLNTGLNRNLIGDIIIGDSNYIFVCDEIAELIITEVNKIKNAKVVFKRVYDKNIVLSENFKELKLFVKSLRVDLLISHVYKLSRVETKELFEKSYVKINHKGITNYSKMLEVECLVSVRGYGRFKICDIGSQNSKGNFFVLVKLYI